MKHFNNILKSIVILSMLLAFMECNNSTRNLATQMKITPPFKTAAVNAELNTIDPSASAELKTSEGSLVSIPANAFVYENGEKVKDSVAIKISEYRTAAEIMMSGIPMKCDSAGETYNFESAGMFEIRGNCRGKEVFLAKGKSIDVDFVSMASGGYDFYFFNEKLGQWESEGAFNKNGEKMEAANDTASSDQQAGNDIKKQKKIVEPKRINSKKSIIDFDISLKNFPELNIYSGIVWQYSDNMKYKNPDSNKWIFKTKWENFELTPLGDSTEYVLKLTAKNKMFVTSVVPVLSEKDYKKAMTIFKRNMDAYNEQLSLAKQELKRQETEAALLRTFSINQLGIYNWDRMYKEPQYIPLTADFVFDKYKVNDFNDITIFFITDDGHTVVKLPKDDWDRFAFNPDKENKIIAVLPEDKVACFGSGDFKNLDIAGIKKDGKYTFSLKVSDMKITSPESLNEILSSI